MKKTHFILLFLLYSTVMFAQYSECGVNSNAADTAYMPYFGQNEVLDSILDITMPNILRSPSSSVSMDNNDVVFHIPVKIWLYHNDNGSNAALSESDVYDLLNGVNEHFRLNNTGIQFYLKCEIEHIYSTQFNDIDASENYNEFEDMISAHRDITAINWHLVYSATGFAGVATYPWSDDLANFSLCVEFGGNLSPGEIITTVHETGHTLGLHHTHDNIRGSGGFNGDANDCQQESVSRSRMQGILCVSTWGNKKCEVNGDALCDTEAAPNKDNATDRWIHVDDNCNYDGSGTDNWGDAWTPPVTNFMSYVLSPTCRNEFTSGQISVMQISIILYMGIGGFPFPNINGTSWYNLNSLALNGTVGNGETKSYNVPQNIVAASNGQYIVNSGANVTMRAGESITFLPGFSASAGSSFQATVGDISCSDVDASVSFASVNSWGIGASLNNANNGEGINQSDLDECRAILLRALSRVGNQAAIQFIHNNNSNSSSNDHREPVEQWHNSQFTKLYQNSPNPFSDETAINFSLPEDMTSAEIKVFDSAGQLLLNIPLEKGETQIRISEKQIQKGLYFYSLIIDGLRIDTKKMIIR
jgi:hypothetical protein